ncbi:MAG TPA: spermidine/putrescine ABC transporter substrate-binding protein [Chroococcidiopsis sp.]
MVQKDFWRRQQSRQTLQLSASRRRFLQLSSAALSGVVLSNCTRNLSDVSSSSASSPAASGASSASGELHVYSWSSYIDEQLLEDFEKKTGIKVIADIFDSNETMLAKLQAGGGGAYSIIYPSDYMVEQMIELDLLSEIDKSRVPGLADLYPQWQSPPYDSANKYSIPFSWGTTGLVYNTEILGEVTDWDYLWDNMDKLERKLTLLNDVREVMGMALKSLGYSNSTTKPEEIEAAYNKLAELKPALNSFTTDAWKDQLLVGDLLMAHAYSVDGIDVVSANPALKYIVPASGATVWTDTIVIPKTAPNVEAAYAWIDYMSGPSTSAEVLSRMKIATPNKKTVELFPTELKDDKAMFPPDAVLEKCEALGNVGEAIDLYDRYRTQLNSG